MRIPVQAAAQPFQKMCCFVLTAEQKVERPQPEPEPQPTQKVCPECGAAVDEEDVFCTNCGARVDSEESSEKDDEQTESGPTDTQQ